MSTKRVLPPRVKNLCTEVAKVLFKGTATNIDYAEHLAAGTLGRVVGHRSDGAVRYEGNPNWCKVQWADGPIEAACSGMPTIALPRKFTIVIAKDNQKTKPEVEEDAPSLEEELASRLRAIRRYANSAGSSVMSQEAKEALVDMCLGWEPKTKRGVKLAKA